MPFDRSPSRGLASLAGAAVALLAIAACGPSGPPPAELYQSFHDKLYAEGTSAPNLDPYLSQKSLAYLDRIAEWAIHGKPEAIKDLSLYDRFATLSLRIHFDDWSEDRWIAWEDSRSHPGHPVMDAPLQQYFRSIISEASLGEVESYRGRVGAQLARQGNPIGLRVEFPRENGWKIDLRAVWHSEYLRLMEPYLTDRYRNLDRVEAMLKDQFGSRFSPSLYEARIGD